MRIVRTGDSPFFALQGCFREQPRGALCVQELKNNQRGVNVLLKQNDDEKRDCGGTALGQNGSESESIQAQICFVSYIHKERFASCLKRAGSNASPGVQAMLYILAGCNELWAVGPEAFFDFDTGTVIVGEDKLPDISEDTVNLLRLALRFARISERKQLFRIPGSYFSSLKFLHYELGLEALKLALFPDSV